MLIFVLRFENPLAGFSTKITSFAPVLARIPPFSIGAKMFADQVRIVFGEWQLASSV